MRRGEGGKEQAVLVLCRCPDCVKNERSASTRERKRRVEDARPPIFATPVQSLSSTTRSSAPTDHFPKGLVGRTATLAPHHSSTVAFAPSMLSSGGMRAAIFALWWSTAPTRAYARPKSSIPRIGDQSESRTARRRTKLTRRENAFSFGELGEGAPKRREEREIRLVALRVRGAGTTSSALATWSSVAASFEGEAAATAA